MDQIDLVEETETELETEETEKVIEISLAGLETEVKEEEPAEEIPAVIEVKEEAPAVATAPVTPVDSQEPIEERPEEVETEELAPVVYESYDHLYTDEAYQKYLWL